MLEGRPAIVSYVTIAELRFGAALAGWGTRRLQRLDEDLARVETVWPGPNLTDVYVALRAWCVRTGHGLGHKEHEAAGRVDSDRTIASAYSVRASPIGLVSAPVTWDELPDVEMADFTIATMPARFAELGDVHAGIDDAVWTIEPLLDWADRDERDHGLGDAPYPPNFPKQEGEPPRVQPPRAQAPTDQ